VTPGVPVPAPKHLKAFKNATWAKPKTPRRDGGGLRDRWKERDGTIYEWDYQHGRVEKYNKRGDHLGEFDADTGQRTGPAIPGRRVEP
jgi:putative cytotoxic protein